MRRKLGKTEVLALLAAAGVSTCAAQAAKTVDVKESGANSLQVIEQPATQLGSGKDSACGKGACGTDESGAKAAAAKHADDAKKAKKPAKEVKKTTKKSGSK